MRAAYFFAGILMLLVVSTLLVATTQPPTDATAAQPAVYIGIYAGSTNATELLTLADQVKSYTNLFVVGSTAITHDLPTLDTVCQKLSDDSLNFLTYVHYEETVPFDQWVTKAKQTWPAHFLGLYAYDEVGGHQIDRTQYMAAKEADNYTDAADKYTQNVTSWLSQVRDWCGQDLPMYESDYVLYDFNYKGGYDGVFVQFGWNFSRTLEVALCRGAAATHHLPWGAIITWTYDVPPYLGSGQQLYDDMVYAYENGAKYILVFDYDKTTTHSMIQQEHLDAIAQFWQYAQTHPQPVLSSTERVAYVLPTDYGFGFRGPTDNIWGLWPSDGLSAKVWNDAQTLLQQYGANLDIVYEDSLQLSQVTYHQVIYYNSSLNP